MRDDEYRVNPTHASLLHGVAPLSITHEVDESPGEEPEPKVRSRWPRRVGWTSAMVAVGVIVGLVIVLGMKFIDGPVSSAGQPTLAEALATPSVAPASNELAGLYVDFTYPGVFDQVARLKLDSNSLEKYMISSTADYSRSIAVVVGTLPTGNLYDDSSYRIRQMDPGTYVLTPGKIKGESVAVFAKVDHSEQTLFWAHGGKVVSVAITSNNPKDNIAQFMQMVESAARWVQ